MGREIKRVPLDFDHPLHQVWPGFLFPDRYEEAPCPAGDRCYQGRTIAGEWVQVIAQLLLQLDDDLDAQARGREMHPYFRSLPGPTAQAKGADLFELLRQGRGSEFLRPGPDVRELGTGLAGRDSRGMFGHDAVDGWRAAEAIVRAAGLDPETWGRCTDCSGHASVEAYPGQRAEGEAWEREEPPTGEGWQLWETTSEGSPIGPVFPSAEALAQWLTTDEGGSAVGFGRSCTPMTIEQARGFVGAGWAPSAIMNAGGLHGGAEYVGTAEALRGHEEDHR